jgi:hypothetical protein
MKKLQFSIVLVISIFFVSCSAKKAEKGDKAFSFDKAEQEVREKIQAVIAEIPSPSEIPFLLQATGAEFNKSLIHAIDDAGKYSTENNKAALNLGIYATDVAYLASYEQSQDALKYTTNLRTLGDQLGLTSAFSPATIKRFEANISSKDSLADIVNEAIAKADRHLKDTDRPKAAALVVGGSFIEGLYLACALVENYPDDILPNDARMIILIPLVDIILRQEAPLIDLIELLESLEKDALVTELLKYLNELKAAYAKLNITELIEKGQGDKLLQDSTLDEITNTTGKIRDFITH